MANKQNSDSSINPQNVLQVGLSQALLHWISYMIDVDRRGILKEESIKYGISEYLEVKKKEHDFSKNNGQKESIAYIKKYTYESPHPFYQNRSIDLKLEHCINDITRFSYIEFKFVFDESMTEQVANDYIDDYFRLATLAKVEKDNHAFFLVTGSQKHLNSIFERSTNIRRVKKEDVDIQKLVNDKPDNPNRKTIDIEVTNVFPLIFSSNIGESKTIVANSLMLEENPAKNRKLTTHLERFNKAYVDGNSNDNQKSDEKKYILSNNDIIVSTLLYKSESQHYSGDESFSVMLWEIQCNSDCGSCEKLSNSK